MLEAAGFHTVEPHTSYRVASAITLVVAVAGPSPSTTFPAVPATNGCEPSVVHTPPEPDCSLTVYACDPPL